MKIPVEILREIKQDQIRQHQMIVDRFTKELNDPNFEQHESLCINVMIKEEPEMEQAIHDYIMKRTNSMIAMARISKHYYI